MSYKEITKQSLDDYLNRLATYYKKLTGKGAEAELILIGGGAIMVNYSFRQKSTDIDALMYADSTIIQASRRVADEYGLDPYWLNDDLKKTESFTPKLYQYSEYYRTFQHTLKVRTVKREYLIAMKLVSARPYKNDLSDVIGILSESLQAADPVSFVEVDKAMNNLYGGWQKVHPHVVELFKEIIQSDNGYDIQYKKRLELENQRKNIVMTNSIEGFSDIQENYFDDMLSDFEEDELEM